MKLLWNFLKLLLCFWNFWNLLTLVVFETNVMNWWEWFVQLLGFISNCKGLIRITSAFLKLFRVLANEKVQLHLIPTHWEQGTWISQGPDWWVFFWARSCPLPGGQWALPVWGARAGGTDGPLLRKSPPGAKNGRMEYKNLYSPDKNSWF